MSFTFWAPDAPMEEICPHPEFDPTFKVERRALPEVSLPNTHARELFSDLGLPVQYRGIIGPDGLSTMLESLRTLQGANRPSAYFSLAEDEHERRCLRKRIEQLTELLEGAAARGWVVQWQA